MKRQFLVALLGLLLVGSTVGCACKGMIHYREIEDSIDQMCEQYNSYIAADQELSESEQATYLRYCVLLDEVIEEAKSHETGGE